MRILMVAPPGAGKGTQAVRLAGTYEIEHLASGEMLRDEVAAGTPLGLRVEALLDRGDLVPDEAILNMVLGRIRDAADNGGFVLDGFPRTLPQAEALTAKTSARDGMSLQRVIHLEVDSDELRRRRRARAALEDRSDDSEPVFEHRLEVYRQQTEPLLAYYDARGLLISLDGRGSPDEVAEQVIAAVGSLAAVG